MNRVGMWSTCCEYGGDVEYMLWVWWGCGVHAVNRVGMWSTCCEYGGGVEYML